MRSNRTLRFNITTKAIALTGIALLLSDTSAYAAYGYCMAPRPPSFYASKPSKPYCATSQSCSSFEVDQYRSSIKDYYSQLEQYLTEIEKFRKLAYEYADCEAKAD